MFIIDTENYQKDAKGSYNFKGSLEGYINLIFGQFKNIVLNYFQADHSNVKSKTSLVKLIEGQLKTLKNSKDLTKEERDIIKKDVKLKSIIVDFFREINILEKIEGKFELNGEQIETHSKDIEKNESYYRGRVSGFIENYSIK